ncbi:centrosomal protein of 89 kDa [Archocentrus centrarchus]|uniref:centrosomal protein of 89 kDa n=1 Tax=Archocentrus centrarchus TaxID=63155 RepID=UPI0011E9DC0C|nr:centrosomal protein of 89 kDa [Archocentrus centrarchus]
MLKFSFRREKDKEFKHIAHGLIPAASIAPKPAVPRTPPPRSPNPSPERPRSALAAAILSSSLTGQTWAIPPARPRSLSESGQSESFISEPNISTALYTRDRWSEDLVSRPRLSSPDQSEGELEDKEEEVENEEDGEEHVYQTLDRRQNSSLTESVYALPLKAKSPTPQPSQRSHRGEPSPDFTEESSGQSPEPKEKKMSVRTSPENWRHDVPCRSTPAMLIADHPRQASQAKSPKHLTELPPEPSSKYGEVRKKVVRDRREKNTRMVDKEKLLEERLQRLEREIRDSKGFSNQRCSAGSQAELQTLRQHAQELVDENDALKLTVHRLNVELSHYQARFRPLSKEEHSKVGGLPNTGSPPPWMVDMKHLSPLLLAYEDRMNEKDALLQITEEDMKKLRVQLEETIKENEKLQDEITKIGAVSQKDCHQLQQQAFLVLQENQVLIDQLEAQHAEAKATHSKHNSEVTKVSKQLMLLEVENKRLQEDLEESRREVQKNMKELQVLQARLKDAVTWDEHCSIAGKLRRQLELQEIRNKSEMDKLLLRVSNLQEENRIVALDKAHLTAKIKATEAELELSRQASRKAERRMSALERQKEECVLKEEKTRHYLGAVISVAEHISQERDRLLHTASSLQQEKQRFISRLLSGTVRFGKLQEEVKVYRSQASTRLAALEEAAEGRTASYQREILHLQRLLRERQEAEEKVLQSKREIEEELEVVWQAATRENQQMRESLWDSKLTGDLRSRPAQAPDEIVTSSQHQHKHGLDFYC